MTVVEAYPPVLDWVGQKAYLRAMVTDLRPDDNNCWVWPFKINKGGYGMIKWGPGNQQGVHRIAFELHHGKAPDVCRHRCDNPPCFNPNHLLDGSDVDNAWDRAVRWKRFNEAAVDVTVASVLGRLCSLEAEIEMLKRRLGAFGSTGAPDVPKDES